jgi:TPR repeat protein
MALSFLGRLFGARPKTVSEDLETLEPLETLETRANRGEADAQFGLGVKFANVGVAQDYQQAAHWYLKAAEQSHGLAQFNLGTMHEMGQGVPRDEAKALLWIQTAANLGDAGAQYKLGIKHHRASFGVSPEPATQSRIEAYKWLHLASLQGYVGSDAARGFVSLNMTIADVSEGARKAAAFVPVNAASH